MSGRLYVIEGLDGSGKATQARRLADTLRERHLPAREISFPNYGSDSSALVKMYLSGQFGLQPSDVNAWAASTFYAVDRYAGMKQDWGGFYEQGGILIADRYTTSNAVHQCCKLERSEWDRYLDWLFEFEYQKLGLPEPDAVVYLRLDVEESQELMNGRYHGDERRKDIHESNLAYLARAREAADYCAARFGWKVIHCEDEGHLRGISSIGEEILSVLGF
ncbi:MAG: deoxynucleoside kinase [Oscillospiraceae bacterium]|nr:deoxynucleoside kinase [Oscillospiraceae bacterium]